MAITNFGELKTAIGDWMMDADTASNFSAADCVTLAQGHFNRKLRCRQMVTKSDLTISSGEFTLPTDYMAWKRVVEKADPRRVLEYITLDKADELYGSAPSGLGNHFSIRGSKLIVYPTPSNDVELTYFARLAAFATEDATDWLLDSYPNLYLNAGMMFAAQFLHDDAKFSMQAQIVQTMIDDLNADEVISEYTNVSTYPAGGY